MINNNAIYQKFSGRLFVFKINLLAKDEIKHYPIIRNKKIGGNSGEAE